ncbi:hypothetical protein ACVWWG_001670 [Bradyrhizobium sp. LB7.2]
MKPPIAFDALWRETKMTHHGNFATHQGSDNLDTLTPSLKLDGVCATLQDTSSVVYRVVGTEMKAAEKRHVSYKQAARPCSRDHVQVVIHHRHADR